MVIVIVTTLLTSTGLAWPSESPTHSSHYDQLKDSIAALSGEVNSIARIIGTLKEVQDRTPQTAPQGYDHLQKTIQNLTDKIAILKTQADDLVCKDSTLTAELEALSKKIGLGVSETSLTGAISELSCKIETLEKKVGSLSSKQGSHWDNVEVALFSLVSIVLGALITKVLIQDREQKKERAKEKLEKFYAPVLGRLQANEDIWENFKGSNDILTQEEKDRITRDNPVRPPANGKKAPSALTPENILKDILQYEARRPARLNIWVTAMEGIFRQNNEAAEKTILENYGYLRPEDVDEDSNFYKERKNYLMHVGEFKAVLHRWEQARKDTRYQKDTNWYDRCRRSCGLGITNSSTPPTVEEFLGYFHPTNSYPDEFLGPVQNSYNVLMDEAGLAKKG